MEIYCQGDLGDEALYFVVMGCDLRHFLVLRRPRGSAPVLREKALHPVCCGSGCRRPIVLQTATRVIGVL